jgi:hypothetical protein
VRQVLDPNASGDRRSYRLIERSFIMRIHRTNRLTGILLTVGALLLAVPACSDNRRSNSDDISDVTSTPVYNPNPTHPFKDITPDNEYANMDKLKRGLEKGGR